MCIIITCSDDDHSTEEANLCVGESEPVYPLGQLEHGVHQELCISGGHRRYRLPLDHITVKTNQALKIKYRVLLYYFANIKFSIRQLNGSAGDSGIKKLEPDKKWSDLAGNKRRSIYFSIELSNNL